jgi:hypothetical protein
MRICELWIAYQNAVLSIQDLRVWFGCHELLTRRCEIGKGRHPSYTDLELAGITELRTPAVRASIGRLARSGFLRWSTHSVALDREGDGCEEALDGLAAMLGTVKNYRRTLPIPRHTLLRLARTRRPVMMATLLGHLFRCVYYRNRECFSWGTCKASGISKTFGVDVRNVKGARKELQACGWLRQLQSHHWHRQRYGGTFVVSLGWDSRISVVRKSPPQARFSTPKSPPPESYKNLPSGIKYQKPDASGRDGFRKRKKREGEPNLLHVVPFDLQDVKRKASLFAQAVSAGQVNDTPSDRLRFFAAMARAKRLASSNPCGFFVTVLRKRLWQNIAHCDEDAVRREFAAYPELLCGPPTQHREMHSKILGRATEGENSREIIQRLICESLGEVHGTAETSGRLTAVCATATLR